MPPLSLGKIMYYYKVEVLRVVDGDTTDVRIDLGFNVWHKCRVRLVGINAPENQILMNLLHSIQKDL